MADPGKRIGNGLYRKKNGKYRAQIWLEGSPVEATFDSKRQAQTWLYSEKAKREAVSKLTKGTLGEVAKIRMKQISRLKGKAQQERHLFRVLDYFGEKTRMDMIGNLEIENFIDRLEGTLSMNPPHNFLSPKTISHTLAMLKSLFKIANEEGVHCRNPRISYSKKTPKKEFTLTIETARAILDKLPLPYNVMWEFGLLTGQRVGDLASMRWDQIQNGQLFYVSTKTDLTGLWITINPYIQGLLDLVKNDTEWLFPSKITGKPYTYTPIRKALQKACILAETPYYNPHKFRHLANTIGLQVCTPGIVQKWIGHQDAAMTELYNHPTTEINKIVDHISNELKKEKESPVLPNNVIPFSKTS